MTEETYCLVTDLDGTFLEGSDYERLLFYSLIEHHKEKIKLVYSTGRSLEEIRSLRDNYPSLPIPNFVIADVGASVYEGPNFDKIEDIQTDIDRRWPGDKIVSETFQGCADLQEQTSTMHSRKSYLLSDPNQKIRLEKTAKLIGCDLLYSHGRYVDILPRDVSKGSTLQKLLPKISVKKNNVFVAGDSLNDKSMFNLGFKGIVVGNALDELKQSLRPGQFNYFSKNYGVMGIKEGLEHYGLSFIQSTNSKNSLALNPKKAITQNINVYCRPLITDRWKMQHHNTHTPRSPNGIMPTLESTLKTQDNCVLVSSSINSENCEQKSQNDSQIKKIDQITFVGVPISKTTFTISITIFQNYLWPLIHSFKPKVPFNTNLWITYLKVNFLFARHIAQFAKTDSSVYFHDYNLWLSPSLLRTIRPDLKIAFFHHTPFPPKEYFSQMFVQQLITKSLLSCDCLSFHCSKYAENFISNLNPDQKFKSKILTKTDRFDKFKLKSDLVYQKKQLISPEGRKLLLHINPVGINISRIKNQLEKLSPEYFLRLQEKTLRWKDYSFSRKDGLHKRN